MNKRRALVAASVLAAGLAVSSPIDQADAAPARCEWLRPHLANAGLPVSTFLHIANRESGCSRNGICVVDRDDASCSRFGLNFKTAGLRRAWQRLCGATSMYHVRNLNTDLRCTRAAYRSMGLRPWRYAR